MGRQKDSAAVKALWRFFVIYVFSIMGFIDFFKRVKCINGCLIFFNQRKVINHRKRCDHHLSE